MKPNTDAYDAYQERLWFEGLTRTLGLNMQNTLADMLELLKEEELETMKNKEDDKLELIQRNALNDFNDFRLRVQRLEETLVTIYDSLPAFVRNSISEQRSSGLAPTVSQLIASMRKTDSGTHQ